MEKMKARPESFERNTFPRRRKTRGRLDTPAHLGSAADFNVGIHIGVHDTNRSETEFVLDTRGVDCFHLKPVVTRTQRRTLEGMIGLQLRVIANGSKCVPRSIHSLAADLGVFKRRARPCGDHLARDRIVSLGWDGESDFVGGRLGSNLHDLRFVLRRRSGIKSVAILHTARRTLLEPHFAHRMLDQPSRAHVVRTGLKIRYAEVAQVVSDCSTEAGNLFSSPRLKLDAQSHDLKALN